MKTKQKRTPRTPTPIKTKPAELRYDDPRRKYTDWTTPQISYSLKAEIWDGEEYMGNYKEIDAINFKLTEEEFDALKLHLAQLRGIRIPQPAAEEEASNAA